MCAAVFFLYIYILYSMSVCDRERVRRRGKPKKPIPMCECVSAGMHECVSEFSDLSVERLHVCLL